MASPRGSGSVSTNGALLTVTCRLLPDNEICCDGQAGVARPAPRSGAFWSVSGRLDHVGIAVRCGVPVRRCLIAPALARGCAAETSGRAGRPGGRFLLFVVADYREQYAA